MLPKSMKGPFLSWLRASASSGRRWRAASADRADPERRRRARAMLDALELCDHCLGRQFARDTGEEGGTPLAAEERGALIRKHLRRPPAARCDLCNLFFRSLDGWVGRAARAAEGLEFDSFQVGSRPGGLQVEAEEELWARFGARWAEPFRQEVNARVGEALSRLWGKPVASGRPDLVLLLDLARDRVEATVNPLFLFGRYRKLVRSIPQTRWPCRECKGRGCPRCQGTGKMYAESVEELLRDPIADVFGARGAILHGAGREDIDARMLGPGRPFVLELVAPRRRRVDLGPLLLRVNGALEGKVELTALRPAGPGEMVRLKEERFDKSYSIRFRVSPAPDREALERALGALVAPIRQQTPTRVVHRRADKVRERKVHAVRLLSAREAEGGLEAEARVDTEGGLYVKELLTGDGGRTEPSLAGLLGRAVAVLELDVLDVRMEEDRA